MEECKIGRVQDLRLEECKVEYRGVAGRCFPGRQEVVALDKYWVAYKELPMALDSMINSPMVLST